MALSSKGPTQKAQCHTLFTTDRTFGYSSELFSRMPDGHIYLAGLNSSSYPLADTTSAGILDLESISALRETAQRLLVIEAETVRENVCWRPVTHKRGTNNSGNGGSGTERRHHCGWSWSVGDQLEPWHWMVCCQHGHGERYDCLCRKTQSLSVSHS